MSFNLGEAVLHLVGDDSKLQNDVKSAKTRVTNILGGLGTGMAAVAGSVGIAVTAVAGIGAALSTTIEPASDLNETASKVGVVFGSAAQTVLDFGKNAASSMGMSEQAALSAAGTYGNLLRALGMTEDKSADMSTSLVQLAGDLASFNNLDPTEVLEKLRSGLTGETEPLKSLGININDNLLKQKAFEMGLSDGKAQLDASTKAQAAYALIMEQTSLAQGDFARTSEGVANQQRILSATISDIKANIGTSLLPIIQNVLGGASKYLGQVSGLIANDSLTMEQKISGVTDIVKGLAGDISANLPQYAEMGINVVKGVVQGIVDSIPQLMPAVNEIILAILTFAIEVLPMLVDGAAKIIIALIQGIAQALPTLIPSIVNVIVTIVMTLIANLPMLIEAAVELISALAQGLVAALPVLVGSLPQIIQALVSGLVQMAPQLVMAAIQLIVALAAGMIQALPTLLQTTPQLIRGIVNGLISGVSQLRGVGEQLMDSFWAGLKSKFAAIWQSVKDFADGIINTVRNALDLHSPSPLAIGIGAQWTDSLGMGIQNRVGSVASLSSQAAGQIAAGSLQGLNGGQSVTNANRETTYQINITNPLRETAETSIKKSLRNLAYFGVTNE
jgi:phage-related protein